MKKFLALSLAALMTVGTLAGCSTPAETSSTGNASSGTASVAAKSDTITVMVPPITDDYFSQLDAWSAEFTKENPNLTLNFIKTSWDDHNTKLSTTAQSGEAPDIAELSYSSIGTYVTNGTAINIEDYMDSSKISEYDQNALDYMTLESKVYGLPLYITIQSIGANKDMLTAAGVDVAKVQSQGWTMDEFINAIKAGTTDNCFGFVFANSGVTASDFLNIFGVSAGLTNAFNKDLKYEYTSSKMLKLLQAVETMCKSGYMPNYGIQANQRLAMGETGQAMIFGKAMPLFETTINANNDAIDANNGKAVANSIKINYAFLPVPTMDGVSESCFGSVDGFVAFKNNNFSEEHEKNVMTALYFMSSGDRAAYVDGICCLAGVCKSSRDVMSKYAISGLDSGNVTCATRLISEVVAPPSGITADMSANATTIMNETIVPKFQSLLAGECTAQQMYDEIVSKANDAFGKDQCVSD